jgi:hypothetical protein
MQHRVLERNHVTIEFETTTLNGAAKLEMLQSALAAARRYNVQLANYRIEMLIAVAASPGGSRDDYVAATGVNPTEAYMCLQELTRMGAIEATSDIRKQGYTITVGGSGLLDRMIGV